MSDREGSARERAKERAIHGAYGAGAAFVDGRFVPVGEARIPILDWGFLHIAPPGHRRGMVGSRLMPDYGTGEH